MSQFSESKPIQSSEKPSLTLRPKFSSIATIPPAKQANAMRVLVADDEVAIRRALSDILTSLGFVVLSAESTAEVHTVFQSQTPNVVLLDLKFPAGSGLDVIDEIRALYQDTVIVVMTGYATVSSAVEAMRKGAVDYLVKPFSIDELTNVLERVSERRRFDTESRRMLEKLRTEDGFGPLIGRSPKMEPVYRILSRVAHTLHPVLIQGESGTGKEIVARLIHYNGLHAAGPFLTVDCVSLAPALIERELFGYIKAAHTRASHSKEGVLGASKRGTVFLDEIGELPIDIQARLARALKESSIDPVGSKQCAPMLVRIIAASNRDLAAMVEQGKFRKDLYLRLNLVNIKLPPLRERIQDVFLLASHFLEQRKRDSGVLYTLSDDVFRTFCDYDWPGNVRELGDAIERACVFSTGPVLHMCDMPTQLQEHRLRMRQPRNETSTSDFNHGSTIMMIAEVERQAILKAVRQLEGDKITAARLLGIGKTTLYRKLNEYGSIERADN